MDATIAAAPRRRNTEDEKKTIKDGRIPEEWKTKPKKLAQKDRDARWTLKRVKARPAKDGEKGKVEIAIPVFGYKKHVSIDRAHGLIRRFAATNASAHDGARPPEVLDKRTRRVPFGPTRPIAPRRTRRIWRRTVSSPRFICGGGPVRR